MVGIKESSFYNHYTGKETLLEAIIRYFNEAGNPVVMTDVEIHALIEQGDVRSFFVESMKRFNAITSNVLYHTAQQIVLNEGFFHPMAAEMAGKNLYHLHKAYTEQVLAGLMERGAIRPCNVQAVTAEYYYALKGMLDELLLLQLWDRDLTAIRARISAHIDFFSRMLSPPSIEEKQP